MKSSRILKLALLILLTGCAHAPTVTGGAFSSPAEWLGRTTRVCGYMPDIANIRPARTRGSGKGLSVDGEAQRIASFLNAKERHLCLDGTIFQTHCGEQICVGWAYPYGIKVKSVRKA